MSRQAKISVLGLYQWNTDLFSLMVIPEGLDLEIFIENLLTETAELEVLYPNYEVMKALIGVWSHKNLPIWEHLYETTQYEYNPIENYNRTDTGRINRTNTRIHSGTDTQTHNTATTNTGNSDEYIAGFDSVPSGNNDGLVKQNRYESSNQGTDQGTNTFAHGEQIADSGQDQTTLNSKGNIGVTTTQKMIREEREIAEFNIYDRMIKDFKERFCIEVY